VLGRRKAPWVRSTASPFAGWCGRRPFKAPHARVWVSPVSRVPRQGLRQELRPCARGDRLPRDRPTYLVPSDVGHRLTTKGVRVDQVGVNPPWRAVAAVGVALVQSARVTATPGLRQSGWLGSARRSGHPPRDGLRFVASKRRGLHRRWCARGSSQLQKSMGDTWPASSSE